jgi:hypothetical protein
MQKLFARGGVMLGGLATSVITAILVVLVESWTNISVFTFMVWLVIPIGAIGCGFVAASGYFLAAKALHQPATRLLLVQMVIIAALTQLLIYWLEYQTIVVNGAHITSLVPFKHFLVISLTSAHLVVHNTIDTGMAIGDMGYWFAVVEFIGFMVGAAAVYFSLGAQLRCADCATYLRKIGKAKKRRFEEYADFVAYFDAVYQHPVDSPEFNTQMRAQHGMTSARGAYVIVNTTLHHCPKCAQQSILESVSMRQGNEWKSTPEYNRLCALPAGVDVVPSFA